MMAKPVEALGPSWFRNGTGKLMLFSIIVSQLFTFYVG